MPDVHAFTSDLDMAMKEFIVRYDLCLSVLNNIGIRNTDIEMALRTTKDFYEKNKEFMLRLVKKLGKPILIELWDERIFYFILKYEFNFVDMSDKASALSTDQIDIENGKRYGIKYTDKNGKQKYPLILHCSPSGAIERVIYALLEKEAIKINKGKKPMLPFWLSPTQIRLIPVKSDFIKICEKYIQEINRESRYIHIRADIDDREESVNRKIRDAEKEWIPIIIVIGEKEIKNKTFEPRFRFKLLDEEKRIYNLHELYEIINGMTSSYPQQNIPLSVHLSKRPKFKY
jgi:threonyl-tRNA synthetase